MRIVKFENETVLNIFTFDKYKYDWKLIKSENNLFFVAFRFRPNYSLKTLSNDNLHYDS